MSIVTKKIGQGKSTHVEEGKAIKVAREIGNTPKTTKERTNARTREIFSEFPKIPGILLLEIIKKCDTMPPVSQDAMERIRF